MPWRPAEEGGVPGPLIAADDGYCKWDGCNFIFIFSSKTPAVISLLGLNIVNLYDWKVLLARVGGV